jgi:hypothetical protein
VELEVVAITEYFQLHIYQIFFIFVLGMVVLVERC